jgi:hypothetical protein
MIHYPVDVRGAFLVDNPKMTLANNDAELLDSIDKMLAISPIDQIIVTVCEEEYEVN